MNSLEILELVSGTITLGLIGLIGHCSYSIIKSKSPSLVRYNEETGRYEGIFTYRNITNGVDGPLMVWDKKSRKYLPKV